MSPPVDFRTDCNRAVEYRRVRAFRQPRGTRARAGVRPRPARQSESLRAPLQRLSHRHDSVSAPAFRFEPDRARGRPLAHGAALVEGGEAAQDELQRPPGGGGGQADVARRLCARPLPGPRRGLVRVEGGRAHRPGDRRDQAGEAAVFHPAERRRALLLCRPRGLLEGSEDRRGAALLRHPHRGGRGGARRDPRSRARRAAARGLWRVARPRAGRSRGSKGAGRAARAAHRAHSMEGAAPRQQRQVGRPGADRAPGRGRPYIGGVIPFRPTLTRPAESEPSGARCATQKTWAPTFSTLRSAGSKDTISALVGTRIFFSPPLYWTVSMRSLPTATTSATLALVIRLSGFRSHG